MKSEKDINHEIRSIEATEYDFKVKSEARQYKKDMALLKFLRHILTYLRTKPSKEFVSAEKKRLDTLISQLMGRYILPENKDEIEKKILSTRKILNPVMAFQNFAHR